MAVFIFDEDALQRMAVVEGPGLGEMWLYQMANGLLIGPRTFPVFKAWYMDNLWLVRADFMARGYGDDRAFPSAQNTTMNGYWGWNRYGLLHSGEIVFLKTFARDDECVQRAREQGFRVDE